MTYIRTGSAAGPDFLITRSCKNVTSDNKLNWKHDFNSE